MSAIDSTPSAYNLLELYRQHRDEVDVLTDQTALFILAFTNEMKTVDVDSLAGDLNLSLAALRAKLAPLLRGQMMLDTRGVLTVTALGRRILTELGFIPPIPPGPTKPPKKPEPPQLPKQPVAHAAGTPGWMWGVIAFLGTGAVALIVVIAIAAIIIFQPQPTPPSVAQVRIDFTADRTDIVAGECATLRWQVLNADWVELNGARVNAASTSQVCPPQTTTYLLIAGGGTGGSRSLIVNVQTPPSPISPTPDAQIVFAADPPRIRLGDCATLRWSVQGGLSVQLDGQGVDRSGQRQVCPKETTAYQLAVDLGARVKRSDASVVVDIPTPTPTPTVNTFPLGLKPLSITFDPTGKLVYVGTTDGTILVLDAGTQRVVLKGTVPSAAVALALSPKGDRLYVATFGTYGTSDGPSLYTAVTTRGAVYALETGNLGIIASSGLQFLGSPRMTLTNDGRFLALTDSGDKSTTLVILETDKLGQIVRTKDGTSPQTAAANRQSSLLYVPAFADDTVSIYNIQADRLMISAQAGVFDPTATIAAKGGPIAVNLSADESLLYIGLGNQPLIDVANTKTFKIDQTIPIPAAVLRSTTSPSGRWLVAISRTTDRVFAIDTGSNRLVYDLGVGKGPSDLDISPDNRVIWVTNSGDGSISIITLP